MSRPVSLGRSRLLCAVAYVVALGAAVALGVALVRGFDAHPVAVAAAGDLVATIVVFGFSRALDNSSVYDPYWSVAPVPIVIYWTVEGEATGASAARRGLVLVLVSLWALRLTYNWARRWEGLAHEDWRYSDLRRKHGRLYWIVSFFGIHLFPTLLVFGGTAPLWVVATSRAPLGLLDAVATLVTVGAIALEARADSELARWLASRPKPGSFLASGVWKHCRHPNYTGEILFWWGLALFGLAARPKAAWVIGGAAIVTMLFVVISVPLIEARMLARKPGYREHVARSWALLPWPRKGSARRGGA